jgi:hypothetical protein
MYELRYNNNVIDFSKDPLLFLKYFKNREHCLIEQINKMDKIKTKTNFIKYDYVSKLDFIPTKLHKKIYIKIFNIYNDINNMKNEKELKAQVKILHELLKD